MISTLSFRVATIRGIPILIDVTFYVTAIVIGLSTPSIIPGGPILDIGWACALLASILLHELTHAAVARHFSIAVAEIRLHLLGAPAVLDTAETTDRTELIVAASGPAVSLGIGVLILSIFLMPILRGADLVAAMKRYPTLEAAALLGIFNIGFGLFNLSPIYPMDGGRLLRVLLRRYVKNPIVVRSVGAAIAFTACLALISTCTSAIVHHHITAYTIIRLVLAFTLINYTAYDLWSSIHASREIHAHPDKEAESP